MAGPPKRPRGHIWSTRHAWRAVLDPEGIAISAVDEWQFYPAISFDGANYVVVWEDWRAFYAQIYGARVTSNGEVLDPDGMLISSVGHSPALAFDGADYFVVWLGAAPPHAQGIFGTRVSTQGGVLDPEGIMITASGDNVRSPTVFFNGTDYLVA